MSLAQLREMTARRFRSRVELVKLMWAASPWFTVLVVLLVVVNALLSAGVVVATGASVGAIPAALRGGFDSADGRRLVALLVAVAATRIAVSALGPLLDQLPRTLGDKAEALQRRQVM